MYNVLGIKSTVSRGNLFCRWQVKYRPSWLPRVRKLDICGYGSERLVARGDQAEFGETEARMQFKWERGDGLHCVHEDNGATMAPIFAARVVELHSLEGREVSVRCAWWITSGNAEMISNYHEGLNSWRD